MTGHPVPRLGIHLQNFQEDDHPDWARLLANAEAADRSGIDKLVVSDHVAFGERLDEYARPEVGGVAGGRQPTGPDGHWLEPVTLMSFLAGRTTNVRFASHVLLAALRRPIVLAKSLSTLDVLADGRIDIGVGVGWQREEYDAAGLPFDDRGRLLDECLDLCTTMWRDRAATITAGDATVERIHQMPKPVQPGGVPIWISGRVSRRVARRLVRFGTGWIPWGDDADDLATSLPRLRRMMTDEGGDPGGLRVVGNLPTQTGADGSRDVPSTMAVAEQLVDAGATDLVARLPVAASESAEEVFGLWAEAFHRRFRT
ncbi:MAG: TIGR03619 family F420-dependent LLM class oxidoreductase [Ilumatobacteraceae bacterium]|nr:TIGR03619 family F420-dependent LLM class oxidoreductase [Ilumatobacteraceae bacterium]